MPHMVCPDDAFHLREAHAQELQNRARYWERALVIEHTGWAEAELKSNNLREEGPSVVSARTAIEKMH